jgi:hypothetical protein
MRGRGPWLAVFLIAAGLGVAGCAATSSAGSAGKVQPAKVEAVAGKNVKSVTLTEQAAKRVGIETVTIAAAPSDGSMTTVPYAAVLYSADGGTWVFVETSPLRYVREKVVVANVSGAQGTEAFLSEGPAVGTKIVKTGVIELYGAELGVGK